MPHGPGAGWPSGHLVNQMLTFFKAGSFEMLGVSECKSLASERLASPLFLRDEAEKSDIAVLPAAHTAIVAKLIVATRTWFSQPNSVGTTCPLDKG